MAKKNKGFVPMDDMDYIGTVEPAKDASANEKQEAIVAESDSSILERMVREKMKNEGKAQISTEGALPNPELIYAEKPATLSDYLEEQRKKLTKEKTDSVKMQKYYALTDALGALGKMGGTAIGGAIGGNMLDSAPVVEEYKPSRGYLDAIEKTKNANDRLRALDEMDFKLAVSQDERRIKQREAAIERDFRKKLVEYEAQLKEAAANKDFEREKELRQLIADLTLQRDTAIQKLQNEGDLAVKKAGQQYQQWQYSHYNTTPVRFSDGTNAIIPDNAYESLKQSLIGEKIGGVYVDEKNVEQTIRKNPQLVGEYLEGWGISMSYASPKAKANSDFIASQHEEPAVEKKADKKESTSTDEDKRSKWASHETKRK